MSRSRGEVVLDHIREVLAAGADGRLSDAQLLDAFARGEEAAFALLVRRHGRLVWGVCRRVLRDWHDAEDAFQATFLVLTRKADSVRKRASLGSWLYGVAFRLSSQLRRRLAIRRQHEGMVHPSPPGPAPDEEISLREALAILDEEVGRLPDKFREPIVLCYFQGKTNDDAARELGCPPGTLKDRLLRARERLSARLAGRGVTLPAGALAVLLAAGAAEAALPAALVRSAAAGVVSAEAIRLAKAMTRAMTMTKVKLLVLGVLAVGLLGTGAGVVLRQAAPGAPPGPAAADDGKGEQPRAKADLHNDPLPPGALARLGTVRLRHGARVTSIAFTGDGKEMLTAGPDGVVRVWEAASGRPLRRFGPSDKPAAPAHDADDPALDLDLPGTRPTALTPDGRTAALVDRDNVVHVWDLAAGKESRRIKPDGIDGPLDIVLSPDGKTLLIAPPPFDIALSDPSRGKERVLRGGRLIRHGGEYTLWDVATGKELRHLEGAGRPSKPPAGGGSIEPVGPPVFSPDGKRIAAPYFEAEGEAFRVGVKVWDVATGKESRKLGKDISKSSVLALDQPLPAFSPDGKTLARIAPDQTIRLHDLAGGNEIRSMGKDDKERRLKQLVFSPDGKRLAVGTADGQFLVFDVDSGKELHTVGEIVRRGPYGSAWDALVGPGGFGLDPPPAAFSPDGKALALAWGDNAVRLWDVATGKPRADAAGHTGAVGALGITGGGKAVVTGGGEGTLREWDAATGKQLRRFPAPDGEPFALAPDGKSAAFLNTDGKIVVWDVAAGKETRTITPRGPDDDAGSIRVSLPWGYLLRFSPDGKMLAGHVLCNTIHLWDAGTGKLLATLDESEAMPADKNRLLSDRLADLAFSRDGHTLVTARRTRPEEEPPATATPTAPPPADNSPRTILCVWDLAARTAVRRWEVPGSVWGVAISPGSWTVATGTETAVTVWEVATMKERFHREGAGRIVAFSPNGRLLAAAGGAAVSVIDTATGKPVARLTGHTADVRALAFTDDGRALLTGSADSTAVVWDAGWAVPPGKESELSARQRDGLWNDLGDADAARAFAAAATLAASPKQAVAVARERLKPAVAPDAKRMKALLAELDSDNFEDREKASKELANLDELARPALTEREALSPEARHRAEELLARLRADRVPLPDLLRGLRVVELLEWTGSAEAKELLTELAKGAPRARLTEEARSALKQNGR
jgi:RNA polymerase sigma factor (sigma-70 family)